VQFADGEPVRSGTIELESKEFQTSASGRIKPDGTFILGTYTPSDGAAAGNHQVIVVQVIINDGSFQHTMDHGRSVPQRYGNYETSGLTASVKPAAENKILIELANQ